MNYLPPNETPCALSWAEVPQQEKARLKRNEARQRRQTEKRGLPALPISVEGLWLIQRGMCTCNDCRGEVPLEVGSIVIAHPHYRAGKGSPGHVPTNVSLWLKRCNDREARKEMAALRRGRRLAVDLTGTKPEAKARKWPKRKNPWNSRFKRKVNGDVVRR